MLSYISARQMGGLAPVVLAVRPAHLHHPSIGRLLQDARCPSAETSLNSSYLFLTEVLAPKAGSRGAVLAGHFVDHVEA